ncbi:MAG: eukaryotic-like serine/threonine-protein kinase [Acidobacteriaceae bacterium]|nr:eukaryotic-like serine/threonine-protein kinase [Acidobacteriaceae bacterium]
MAYIEGDQTAAARETLWYAGKPEEYLSFGLQAANRNVLGQRRESGKLYKRAAETALHRGLTEVAAAFEEADARADALSGNCGTARHLGRAALALCGDTTGAQKLAADTSKRFPNGTIWNAVQLPEIRAAIELQRGQPARAVELLASASPYERAYPEAVYLRGLAYLRLHKGPEAAAEFQKILDHKGASWASTWRFPNWGTVLLDLLRGAGACLCARGRHGESREGVQGLLRTMEGRRPESPYSHSSKERLRGTTLVSRQRNTFGISDEMYQAVLESPLAVSIASDCARITGNPNLTLVSVGCCSRARVCRDRRSETRMFVDPDAFSRTHHLARYSWCRTPIVTIHLSTNSGHAVTGRLVRRKPKAWPPCAYRCIQLELRPALARHSMRGLAPRRLPCRPRSGGERLAVSA